MADLSEKLQKLNLLVEQFRKNIDYYKTLDYKEARVRTDFIDKFFTILDWDINNEEGCTEDFRDVVIEDNLEIQGAQKAPDYSFRIGGTRVFFVEAKKPSINVKEAVDPAFQVRRYGYTAKLPLSILTDFEEFAIYDTRLKPSKKDDAKYARIFYCRFDEYEKNFEFIYNTFSKAAVKKGSIKQYIEGKGIKKGVSEVDKEFLKLIEDWRSHLAKNIALRNLKLDIDQLNLAVQKIIDRIIFLRIAEDKEIELYETLLNISKETKAYQSLVTYFEKANKKYNSELFKRDQLLDELKIDNEVLTDIIQNLYYPDSPYAFSVLPVEILGNIYEQFLGKTIRLTTGHQAKIEEKPEVRKAGGVYYTPQYIVDYIVTNTVGEKIRNNSPKEIEKLKILDPACGSGSFLLGAYAYLLNYHLKYYVQKENLNKALKNNCIFRYGEKSYHLTIQEKQKILLNNIYGVDIDKQATEVTKLSLMLKLLEGENNESAGQLFKQTDLKLLPTLSENIKCGNSLISSDYYKDKKLGLFATEDMNKINVFDWGKEFPTIFKNGGFDCVIGNPPYVRQELLGEQKEYYKQHYQVFHGMADLYQYFIEKGISLLNTCGIFGIIVANKWMRTNYGAALRKYIVDNTTIHEIIDFGELPVFENAATFPLVISLSKQITKTQNFKYLAVKTLDFDSLENEVHSKSKTLGLNSLGVQGWTMADQSEINLIEKINHVGTTLGEYVGNKIYYGVKTGLNEAFVINDEVKKQLIIKDKNSAKLIKPFANGDDIRKWHIRKKGRNLIFIPDGWTDIQAQGAKDKWLWFQENYPAIAEYLSVFENNAKNRWDKGQYWWELRPCDYYSEFEKEKIVYPDIAKESRFTLDTNGTYVTNTAYFIPLNDLYLLAILNSKLIYYFFKKIASVLGDADKGGRLRWFTQDIIKIPIANCTNNMRSRIMFLVKQLLELSNVEIPEEKKLAILNQQIDTLVYELYGLTEEEIKIVEDSVK
jgi:type I restriction-modification system DNA methylase subunit